ncbi:glycosyltransferase family protein [Parahaliea maris]|nr:hypothetical protein [Parahaliea maris]
MSSPEQAPRKLLAVCSGGGHLIELLRLAPAFEGHQLVLASTASQAPPGIEAMRYYCLTDSNASQKLRLLQTACQTARIVFRERPRAVISTGAAPGLLALAWARLLGCRLIWIDSIANPEKMSLSGRIARRLTPHCYTQWQHLGQARGVKYLGSIMPLAPGATA